MTLDNYIMESEINDATVGDIYVEQALAEMEVAYAIATSYIKDAMFVEYLAEMNGVDIYQEGFFAESDGSFKDKLKNIGSGIGDKFKNAGTKIKEAPGKAWEFLKRVALAIVTAITNLWKFLSEKSISACIKKLKNTGLEASRMNPWKVPAYLETALDDIFKETDRFANGVQKLLDETKSDKTLTSFESTYRGSEYIAVEKTDAVVEMSSEEVLALLEKSQSKDVSAKLKETVKLYKEIAKICDKNIKSYAKDNYDDRRDRSVFKKNERTWNKEELATVKKYASAIIKAYSQLMRDFRTLANRILKSEVAVTKATEKRAKARQKADETYNNQMRKALNSQNDTNDQNAGIKTR